MSIYQLLLFILAALPVNVVLFYYLKLRRQYKALCMEFDILYNLYLSQPGVEEAE